MPIVDPNTAEQWQNAVDAANACLAIDAARQYGLITGGPMIDQERCQELLTRGAARGILPAKDSPERYVKELMLESLGRHERRAGKWTLRGPGRE